MGDTREQHAALREQELTSRLFGGSAAHPVQEHKADNAAPAPLASLDDSAVRSQGWHVTDIHSSLHWTWRTRPMVWKTKSNHKHMKNLVHCGETKMMSGSPSHSLAQMHERLMAQCVAPSDYASSALAPVK